MRLGELCGQVLLSADDSLLLSLLELSDWYLSNDFPLEHVVIWTAFSFCGDRGGTVVKVLCYKSEGSIPDGVIGIFH